MNAEIRAGLDRLQAMAEELETRVSLLEEENEIIIDAVAVEDTDE